VSNPYIRTYDTEVGRTPLSGGVPSSRPRLVSGELGRATHLGRSLESRSCEESWLGVSQGSGKGDTVQEVKEPGKVEGVVSGTVCRSVQLCEGWNLA
jgi:hypothetical protein